MTSPSATGDWIVLLPYMSAALTCFALAVAVGLRLNRPLAKQFTLLLWLEFSWSILLVLEILSPGIEAKIFFDNLQFPVSVCGVVVLLQFARAIDPPRGSDAAKHVWLLYLPAAVSAFLAFTDPLHHLLRSAPALDSSLPFGELVYGFTLADYVLFTYSIALAGYAIVLLLASYSKATTAERRKYRLVILGLLIPIAGALPPMLDIRLLGRRDLTPIWFAIGSVPIFMAIFRYRAFATLLKRPARRIRGRLISEILAAWPEAGRLALKPLLSLEAGEELRESVTVSGPAGDRVFKVDVSSIPGEGGGGAELCRVALFRDVTELEREISRRKAAEEGLRRAGAKMLGSQREILATLSEVVENRSPETANHVLRVGEYSRILATACGLSPEGVSLVASAAPLHDVGKIAIPDSILNKPGVLTDEEMAVIRTHAAVGYSILGTSERSIIRAAAVIALEHHERWDGNGYPAGKAGNAISLSGRIVCICDVFDALSTSRPYKKPWETARILEFFQAETGRMFDPSLVAMLFANQERFLEVATRYPEAAPPWLSSPPAATVST